MIMNTLTIVHYISLMLNHNENILNPIKRSNALFDMRGASIWTLHIMVSTVEIHYSSAYKDLHSNTSIRARHRAMSLRGGAKGSWGIPCGGRKNHSPCISDMSNKK
jgi:hypothetical protein